MGKKKKRGFKKKDTDRTGFSGKTGPQNKRKVEDRSQKGYRYGVSKPK